MCVCVLIHNNTTTIAKTVVGGGRRTNAVRDTVAIESRHRRGDDNNIDDGFSDAVRDYDFETPRDFFFYFYHITVVSRKKP